MDSNNESSNVVKASSLLSDEDDLEDGEIEDDDDDDVNNGTTTTTTTDDVILIKDELLLKDEHQVVVSSTSSTTTKASASASSLLNIPVIDLCSNQNLSDNNKIKATSNKLIIKKKSKPIEDDFASNIENAIAAALKKDGIEPPLPKILDKRTTTTTMNEENKTDFHSGTDDSQLVTSSAKRRARKKRKRERERAEKEKHDKKPKIDSSILVDEENDDIDDLEMLCVRGGSPPPINVGGGGGAMSAAVVQQSYYNTDNSSSYESYDSDKGYRNRQERKQKDRRYRKRDGDRKRNHRDNEPSNGVCIANLRGQCNNADCGRNHDGRSQRKLELCKFYLMECCAKKDKCSYMHSDFPCKYYYLGMDCIYKSACKFSHGKPLNEQLRNVLIKHIETAPKEILGTFKRMSREFTMILLAKHHDKLCQEFGIENTMQSISEQQQQQQQQQQQFNSNNNNDESRNIGTLVATSSSLSLSSQLLTGGVAAVGSDGTVIPSLLDMVIKPPKVDANNILSGIRQRKSRWAENKPSNQQLAAQTHIQQILNLPLGQQLPHHQQQQQQQQNKFSNEVANANKFILNLRMLSNIISMEQIEKLESLGVENLEQMSLLNLTQLNQVGLTATQISEIQLNAINMVKLGLLPSSSSSSSSSNSVKQQVGKISSNNNNNNNNDHQSNNAELIIMPTNNNNNNNNNFDDEQNEKHHHTPFIVDAMKAATTDVDMRVLPNSNSNSSKTDLLSPTTTVAVTTSNKIKINDGKNQQQSMDYSQYLKDSNINLNRNDFFDDEEKLVIEDEEPELRIDESWSDSDNGLTKDNNSVCDGEVTPTPNSEDSNESSSQQLNELFAKLPPTIPAVFDPLKLLDAKRIIDVSSTVSNMLAAEAAAAAAATFQVQHQQHQHQHHHQNHGDKDDRSKLDEVSKDIDAKIAANMIDFNTTVLKQLADFRDPRLLSKTSDSMTTSSSSSSSNSKSNIKSIKSPSPIKSPTREIPLYERISIYDGNQDDDLQDSITLNKKSDKDMRMADFIDTSNSDIDLRYPFKPVMQNYIPATEIDAAIQSHAPIQYRVNEIEIQKPDYSEIRRSIPVNEKTLDPRLRRIFCLKELPKRHPIQLSSKKTINSDEFTTTLSSSGASGGGGTSESESENSPYPTFSSSSSSNIAVVVPSTSSSSIISINSNTLNRNSSTEISSPRQDPRRKIPATTIIDNKTDEIINKNSSTDIRMLLQRSQWYKDLNSKHKIMVNQQLALITTELKKFHLDLSPQKIFDVTFIVQNQMLQQILTNLGIYIDDNGQVRQIEIDFENNSKSLGPINLPPQNTSLNNNNNNNNNNNMPPVNPAAVQITQMDFLRRPPPQQQQQQQQQQKLPQLQSRYPATQQQPAVTNIPPPGFAVGMTGPPPPTPQQHFGQITQNIRPGLLGIAPGIGFGNGNIIEQQILVANQFNQDQTNNFQFEQSMFYQPRGIGGGQQQQQQQRPNFNSNQNNRQPINRKVNFNPNCQQQQRGRNDKI